MRHMRKIIGYENGDSIMAPGGSVSNLYAAMAARHKMFPDYKEHGLRHLPGQLIMFTSMHVSPELCLLINVLTFDENVIESYMSFFD